MNLCFNGRERNRKIVPPKRRTNEINYANKPVHIIIRLYQSPLYVNNTARVPESILGLSFYRNDASITKLQELLISSDSYLSQLKNALSCAFEKILPMTLSQEFHDDMITDASLSSAFFFFEETFYTCNNSSDQAK